MVATTGRERAIGRLATRVPDVRLRPASLRSLALAAAVVTAGCAAAAPPPDAYDQLSAAIETSWSPIQVNVGLRATTTGSTFELDARNLAFVLDTAGGRAGLHVSLPAADLEIPVGTLRQLGIDGDSIDFDLVYAGDALYVRSPVLRPTLRMILGPTGKLPAGDLGGWLKLGTKEELTALAALGGSATGGLPSFAPPSAGPGSFRTSLEAAGIAIASAGAEQRNGADRLHLTFTVDTTKLAADPNFRAGAGAGGQRDLAIATVKDMTVSGDLWIDPATNHVVEMSSHVASAANPADAGDVIVTVIAPDGSVPLDVPSSFVDIPLGPLLTEAMKLLGRGAES
jgi:hypothetical protein